MTTAGPQAFGVARQTTLHGPFKKCRCAQSKFALEFFVALVSGTVIGVNANQMQRRRMALVDIADGWLVIAGNKICIGGG